MADGDTSPLDPLPPNGPHDYAGQTAGPVDRHEHDLAWWERLVDAQVMLLFQKGVISDLAQLRRVIEDLGPDVYERLSYYERWAAAAAERAIERGLVTREEIDARIAAIQARREAGE